MARERETVQQAPWGGKHAPSGAQSPAAEVHPTGGENYSTLTKMDFLTICSPAIEISEGDRAYATRGPALTGEGGHINFRTGVCDFKVARSVPNRITPPVTPYFPQIRRRGLADVPRRARGQGRKPLAEQKLQGATLAEVDSTQGLWCWDELQAGAVPETQPWERF